MMNAKDNSSWNMLCNGLIILFYKCDYHNKIIKLNNNIEPVQYKKSA